MATRIRVGGKDHDGISYKGITITYEGHTPEEIAKIFNDLGYIPAGALKTPVRKSAVKVQSLARKNAPRRTGALIVGLTVGKIERTATKGKIVYDVRPAKEMDMAFAKISKAGKRGYYPASMEYGFVTKSGKRWTGKHYMRDAAISLQPYNEQLIMDAMWKKVMSIWEKKNGGSE